MLELISGNTLHLDQIFELYSHKRAIFSEPQTCSYQEFKCQILGAINSLSYLQIAPKEHVGIQLTDPQEYIVTLFALWHYDACPILLSPLSPPDELEQLKHNFNISHIITKLQVSPSSKIEYLNLTKKLDNNAAVVFTSGSTSLPKAIILSFENLFFSALGTIEFYHFNQEQRWHLSLPLHHVGGLMIAIRVLWSGMSMIISPLEVNTLRTYSPTILSLVPTQLIRLIKSPEIIPTLQRCQAILLGGAHIPKTLLQKGKELSLNLYATYGLTESAAQIASSAANCAGGTLLPYRLLKINEQGQILIGGKTRCKGMLLPQNQIVLFDDFLNTNDLGYFDENNLLQITGRSDLIFISGGENINPFEIEALIMQFAEVDNVVVPKPDQYFGMVPIAFIYTQGQLDIDSLKRFLAKKIPHFKIPKEFVILPAGSGLKPSREELKKGLARN